MSMIFLILAFASVLWGGIAFALAESHPTPSLTTLIPQVLIAAVLCAVSLAAATVSAIISLIGG